MLTIFSTPKPFKGHIGTIQRNAIRSWTMIRPAPEVILFGNDEGVAEAASELGVRHAPDTARNEYNTPLLSDIFEKIENLAANRTLCYVNSDIILMNDLAPAAAEVEHHKKEFLMIGKRWDAGITEALDFSLADWDKKLREDILRTGTLMGPYTLDYFVFPKGLYRKVPPFGIGRGYWDTWLVFHARKIRCPVVDATPVVTAVHQSHDYAHLSPQFKGMRHDEFFIKGSLGLEEFKKNRRLLDECRTIHFGLWDATYILTPEGFRPTSEPEYLTRHLVTIPVLYPRSISLATLIGLDRLLKGIFGTKVPAFMKPLLWIRTILLKSIFGILLKLER